MKQAQGFFLGMGLMCALLLVQSCCKEVCIRNDLQLQFIQFERQDADTLLLLKYEPGGAFTTKLDSFYAYPHPSGPSKDTLYAYLKDIDYSKDWEIQLPAVNRTYRISDIRTAKEHCPCGSGSRWVVSAYRLQQGDLVHSQYIEIKK